MLWIILSLIFASSGVSVHYSLISGVLFALVFSQYIKKSLVKKWSKYFLQSSIILLGASLPLGSIFSIGPKAAIMSFSSIFLIMILGKYLAKMFSIEDKASKLVSFGTAICGGSAIAVMAPIIGASSTQISQSLFIVFILNALALFLFPTLGHFLHLSESDFGLFAALAIHDTSSVVAAGSLYGQEALKIATTIKLVRATWIIPFSLYFVHQYSKLNKGEDQANKKISYPLFILGFLAFSLIFTSFPMLSQFEPYFQKASKVLMSSSLFLIGLTLTKDSFSRKYIKLYAMGFSLWLLTSLLVLFFISVEHVIY